MDTFFIALAISGLLVLLGLSRQLRATRYLFVSMYAVEHVNRKYIPRYVRDLGILEMITGFSAAALLYVTYEIFKLNIYMLIWVPALVLAFAANFYINNKYMGHIRKLELLFSIIFIVTVGVAIVYFCC